MGSALALFLATTDATIISTSLPSIANDLSASRSEYTWVGVAYMLTQTAFQPLYGCLSQLVGQKVLLFMSMTIFAVGSFLCGVSQSITWLITCRALSGIGGGGIVASVWVITSRLVAPEKRAQWSQALSVTWCSSAVAGPLLGGVFSSEHNNSLSWRWGFFLNLPIAALAGIILVLSLKNVSLADPNPPSWSQVFAKFDFIGLFFFMTGTCGIIVGFSFSTEIGWATAQTIASSTLGLIVLILGGLYEVKTTREPLFPPVAFRDHNVVAILVITFLHNVAFTAGTFYLVIYFQIVNSMTPLQAGISTMPYSLGGALASVPVAWFLGWWQKRRKNTLGHNLVISVGLLASTVGFGLMITMDDHSNSATQFGLPLLAGIGTGMLFHAPYQVFTFVLQEAELPSGTSAFFLVRFTGATIGLACAGTVFFAKASSVSELNDAGLLSSSRLNYEELSLLGPLVRTDVVHAIASSIKMVWIVCTPCLGVATVISFLIRVTSTDRDESQSKQEKVDGA